jgi:hypothetical protein
MNIAAGSIFDEKAVDPFQLLLFPPHSEDKGEEEKQQN